MSAKSLFAALLVGITVAGSCKTEEPAVPVVTTIVVAPATRTFTSLTLPVQFSATVRDQNGNTMTGQAVVWGTSNGTVATVSLAGLVTSQAVGTANITATIGTVSGQGVVTVTQVPRHIQPMAGDAQSAVVGTAVGVPLVARVSDSLFLPIPGIAVGFAVTAGGGSVGTPSAVTNGSGDAGTTWTLGTTSGTHSVTASAAGVPSFTFNVTGLAAAADTIIKVSTDGQTVPAGTPVLPAPAVRVRDQYGNNVPGVAVTFAITQGGGQLAGASASTNGSGIATVGSWVVGASGTQELTATAAGAGVGGNPITFTVTAQSAGAPTSVVVSDGNNQTGLSGFAVNVPPAALVRDASSNPVAGVTVDFQVTAGGGSLTGATAITDLQGIARVGSWSINLGVNTLTASVAGITTPATFNATGVNSTFNITLRYTNSTPTATQSAAFDSAAARWSRVIIGDIPATSANITAASCFNAGLPPSNETIDDVLIFVMLVPIDGVNGVLGSAGPCAIGPNGQAAYGLMRFDTADLPNLENNGILEDVMLHEMAHVLGLGTLWENQGLLAGKSVPGTSFTGAQARTQFDAIGGAEFTGAKVPVEDCVAGVPANCGDGTRNGHWREFVFLNELMTGYVDSPNPLSVVTSAQFADLGYQVNLAESDAFSVSVAMLRSRTAGPRFHLQDDILRIPIDVLDASGRVMRVIPPTR